MKILRKSICVLGGHRINRRRVRNDGRNFRTKCVRCGQPMVRGSQGWIAGDSNLKRKTADGDDA